MFKRIFTVLFLLIGCGSFLFGQSYNGPDSGGVAAGAVVSTDNYSRNMTIVEPTEHIWNEETEYIGKENDFMNFNIPTPKEGSNYFEDPNVKRQQNGRSTAFPFLLKNFEGIPMGNSIPPDPYIAVGPDNVIAIVNTSFRIFDKEGNILKTISADSWFQSVFPASGAFDPKILYDVIDQRWIMVWLQQNDNAHTSSLLLSVSDDSDPLGTWYNWALPANLNGTSNSNTWTDYEGVGYDQNAIYIAGNQWSFPVGGQYIFQYTKIRIIPKAQLYANTAGNVSWNDIWNIGGSPFTIRPSIMYTTASKYYLVFTPYQGNYFVLYNITNSLTNPTLSSVNVPVTNYFAAPNASQLGGGLQIEVGSRLQNEPKFRDGYLYVAHAVRNPTNAQYSAIHYVKINVGTNTTAQDYVFGADGYWHFYPSVDVDIDGNIAMAYSRSSLNEYPGAYLTGRFLNDPPGFMGSLPLAEGKGNYVVTFGGDRNRWGDYTGIQLDPVDQNSFWALSEFASATNTWDTQVGKINIKPLSGPYLFSLTDSLDFHNVEVGNNSDTLTIGISNYGSDDVIINDIPAVLGPFHLTNNFTFPLTLSTYDSLYVNYVFTPENPGPVNEVLTISSNATNFQDILLKGRGYVINQAILGAFYAVSGTANNGSLYTLDASTGSGTLIGNSDFDDIDNYRSLTISPKTGIIYGLTNIGQESAISKVNSSLGDAYILYTLPIQDMFAVAFDTSGTLYGFLRTGDIYKIDINDGSYTLVVTADIMINAAAFDPLTNELWATPFVAVVGNKDAVYKIDLTTGTSTLIGNTGFGIMTNDIDFDAGANLFGVTGSGSQANNFISINKSDGTGTIIGSINYPNITGLAYARAGVTGVKPVKISELPVDYSLKQNYPNPFNPSTTIEYSLPVASNVTITIYNLLGEVVNTVVNRQQNAGYHTVSWNSNDNHGSKVGSGVYFYELKANGSNGAQFTQIRKMVLLK
ncbi:MAG TPA: FlgD immunoglobulin-like domain containing protein [Ignavibacteriaceae bacterium]|nr:FlgD immunoglobulin-like domain containing protein [Ignavibacteriaceae bacterium]